MNLDKLFGYALKEGIFPGAVLLIGNHEKVLFFKSYGYRALSPAVERNSISTIYDLASLTKVVATTPAIMKLVEDGMIRLNDPVKLFIKEFSQGRKTQVTVRHLLTHTSGLPPYTEEWKENQGAELLSKINETELVNGAGEKYVYSCLNFVLLMEIVELVSRTSFHEFLRSSIFDPLEMNETFFTPPTRFKSRIAPTSERKGRMLRGEVDDEISYYLGGVSGNAGLFSTAEDLYIYAKMMLNEGTDGDVRIFSKSTVRLFCKETFNDGEIRRGLGWEMKSNTSSCGDLMSDEAYGHTGFTGTSLWIDPIYDVIVVLMTNRVHISRRANQAKMARFRGLLHNYVMGHMEKF